MDIAVGLPALFPNEILEMAREGSHTEIVIGCQLLVVRRIDGDDVAVGSQQVATLQFLHMVGRLVLQRDLDFCRYDTATEHSGESIANGAL